MVAEIKVSVFLGAKDNAPKLRTIKDWDSLADELTVHRVVPDGDKHGQPAISPAEYPTGAARSAASARRAHFVLLDCDKLTQAQMEEVLDRAAGLEAVLYTTWSHPERHARDGSWSFRLVMPATRPVEAHEWKAFWGRLQARFGGLPDVQCSDISRIYYAPSSPTAEGNVAHRQRGRPVDVDEVLADPEPEPGATDVAKVVIGKDDLQELATRLSRAGKAAGKALSAALKGKPMAEPGERDNAMFKVACAVAERWPGADPAQVAGLLADSVQAMQDEAPDSPDLAQLEEKIGRACQKIRGEMDRLAQERKDAVQAMVSEAFAGVRSEPYTKEEIEGFAQAAGCTVQQLQRRWVVQLGRAFYFFLGGQYGLPVPSEAMAVRAERDLAPASTAGVTVWRTDRQGQPRIKTPQELMVDYGTVADRAVADMVLQKSYYDAATGTIYEAPCPLRPLESAEVKDVAEWLEAFAGTEHARLLDWIAAVTWLDQPCAALYLDGPKHSGKSMLAQGLARLWSEDGPTQLEDIMGTQFNDSLPSCPLVLGDEVLPEVLQKGAGTGHLRQFIQARRRSLRRKFMPTAIVRGAVRLILAANNRHMLDTYEALTPADIEAVAERVLYIRSTQHAADILMSLGKQRMDEWVEGDELARHALWLRDTRQVDRRQRFIVSGEASALHRALSTSQGMASAVCHWCVGYLLEPGKMDTTGLLLARVSGGRLLVHVRALAEHWSMYQTNVQAPPSGRIARALSSLSAPRKVQMAAAGGKRINYWDVDPDSLLQWALDNGYCTEDELHRALLQDTRVDGMPDPGETQEGQA